MIRLLPREVAMEHPLLQRPAASQPNSSIGYMSFVEMTHHAIGVCEEGRGFARLEGEEREVVCRHLADTFLWAVFQEIPPELKSRIAAELPLDLRSRASLYTDSASHARVA
jgi:hypothetical protein